MDIFKVIRGNIARIAALVLVGLALNALYRPSPVIEHYISLGIPAAWQASCLLGGALVLIFDGKPEIFLVGTLPFAIYVCTTIYIVLDRGAGYPTALVYGFAYLQLLALYDCEGVKK